MGRAARPAYDPLDFALLQEGGRLRELQVPVAVALGHYEKLTDAELDEHAADIHAELTRRQEETL